ncbi:hypothetical protein PQQ52_17885 [Paraburkholderia sediminicola]|uniref:hypothetical protein n=1 Tax=Paraburkholderia sediminicola TaxID=458836 RepID=UPI0038BCB814
MRTKAERRAQSYSSMAFAGLTVGGALLLVALLPIWHRKVHIDKCPFDAAGKVIPDRTADGVLTLAADIYFVHRDGMDDSIVASWKKGGAIGPAYQISRHVGELAHVEYCGRTVTRVTASGVNVFEAPPGTQATLDAKADSDRRWAISTGATFLLWGVLCLLKLRLIRREAAYTIG